MSSTPLVHDLVGTLLIVGVWLCCAVGGGLLSSFIDGERKPVRNVLGLLALGYPIVVTQSLRGWAVVALLAGGLMAGVLSFLWYRNRHRTGP